MDNTKLQAARDLRKLSVMLRGILALGEEIEEIGSLDQAAIETESRLRVAQADEARLTEALRLAETAIEAAGVQREQLEAEARETAASVAREAESQTAAILAEAKAWAARHMDEAETRARAIDSKTVGAEKALRAIEEMIQRRESERNALEGHIAAVKKQIAQLG